jgi:hypothetical protein
MLENMKKNIPGRFVGAVAILAVASQVHAQQAPRCSDLFDDAQRLACYDAAFGKPSRTPAGGSTAAPSASAPVTRSAATALPSAPASSPAPAAPVAVPAPAAAPALAAQPLVGTSAVTQVARTANGRFVVTLDNGQVWGQLERDPTAEVQIGDKVTVRKASLGSYMMVTKSGVRTRVHLQ